MLMMLARPVPKTQTDAHTTPKYLNQFVTLNRLTLKL